MINNHEVSKNSLNSYENNSQFLSRLAILIVSNAAKDLINNDRQFKEINNEINGIFKINDKCINTLFNEALFELTGDLHLNLINELHKILSTRGLIENKKIRADDVPEIYSNIFLNDNNENNKFNQRTLGIILYSIIGSLIFYFKEYI